MLPSPELNRTNVNIFEPIFTNSLLQIICVKSGISKDIKAIRITNFITRHMWDVKLKIYDELVAKCPRFRRSGKTLPYTSANGYMFSTLNKAGQLGIRFSKATQEKYIRELNTTYFKSYGAVLEGYVLIPDEMLNDLDNLANYLNESYDYIMSLEPK